MEDDGDLLELVLLLGLKEALGLKEVEGLSEEDGLTPPPIPAFSDTAIASAPVPVLLELIVGV